MQLSKKKVAIALSIIIKSIIAKIMDKKKKNLKTLNSNIPTI